MRYTIVLSLGLLACASAQPATRPAPAPQAPPPLPARVTYAPAQARYRAVQHTHQRQMMEGNPQEGRYVLEVLATVSLSGPAGVPMAYTFGLDSVRADGGVIMPAEIARAHGTRLTGTISPEGVVTNFTGDSTLTGQLQNIAIAARQFYPRLPAGGVEPGQAWSDTSETKSSGATQLTIRIASDRKAIDWTDQGGRRTLHVAVDATYTVNGTGQQMGQDFTISGNGIRHGDLYISAEGTYLGATSRDSSNVTVSLPAIGMSFPSIQIRHDTVSVIP